jgi:hypothetical protein
MSNQKTSTGDHESAPDVSRDEMIGSLGEALAGVNLGPNNAGGNGFSFHSDHATGSPFPLASPPANNAELQGWGYAAEASRNSFARSNAQEVPNPPQESSATEHERKQSIDRFLSQSPSQMLGQDVFKLSTNNLPGLGIPEEEGGSEASGNYGGFRPSPSGGGPLSASPANFGQMRQNPEIRRRIESPTGTGTTSSSRSGSPYGSDAVNESRRGIGAYHGYDAPSVVGSGQGGDTMNQRQLSFGTEEDRSNNYNVNSGHGSHPQLNSLDGTQNQRMQSPYGRGDNMGNNRSMGFGSPYANDQGSSPQNKQPAVAAAAAAIPQQQVLYMAVPTPDGRGQVLQPVQMVQLPGKPFAYVVPGAGAGGMPAQGMGGDTQQPPMMVLPSMQGQGNNDLTTGILGGKGGRNDNRNAGMGGFPKSAEKKPFVGTPTMGGLLNANDDFNSNAGNYDVSSMNPNQTDPLASLYATPQRPPLDALLGQVRRLSRDQVGCRLVQQALDEEGPMAATLILNEGLPFWGEAMVDPFGNYLFQKILEKITPEERIMLVKSVSTRLVNASLNLHGTRSVQKVVELCALDEERGEKKDSSEDSAADILTRALAPAAARLCIDSHGNHVIQRILLKLSHEHSKFVFDAVAESVGDVARHRHGCCVIQRCLDSPPSKPRSHLVLRIVDKSLELMQDAYGNYVVQYVLDVCSDEDVHAVCESVVGRVNILAIQKFSSNVMEKCLERCTDRVKEQYMAELSDTDRVRELMMDPFGNYVVQRALSVATHAQAVRLVESMRPHLLAAAPGTPNGQRNGGVRNTAGGRRIMAKICRRFPNFTLNAVGSREELYSQNKGHHRHQHPAQGMAPAYAQQLSPGPQQAPQHYIQNYQNHHADYNQNPQENYNQNHHVNYNQNPIAGSMRTHQYDQRQPYYDIGDTGYYQHTPQMGHGPYPGF